MTHHDAIGSIPQDWAVALGPSVSPESLAAIADFVAAQPNTLPAPDHVFAALDATPLDSVRAVILGQDPYPTRIHAMGLAFSVPPSLQPPMPRSLQNIRAELRSDGDWPMPDHGSLEAWCRHGVLLLNTSLTVTEGRPGSHRLAGWQALTDAIVEVVVARFEPTAFLLWGKLANSKAPFIDRERHVVVSSSHPSPLSQKGFLGSRPFSRANEGLLQRGAVPIDWSLKD